MVLPHFRYHPDPIASGSIVSSDRTCVTCAQARGYIYAGPVYAEEELGDALCPWCISDGSAHQRFAALFVDTEAFPQSVPGPIIDEISQRTPGYAAWQGEQWPSCCDDATAFIMPAGLAELRARALEGFALNHIIYEMQVSGGAATRLLQSLNRDKGPTAFLFECLHCQRSHFHIDHA